MKYTEPNMTYVGDHFDDIYYNLLNDLLGKPQYVCSPRGSKIHENLVATLVLNNPRARILSTKQRDANYGFAVGEFLWYWKGNRDLNTMVYYNKRMKNFSDDGHTLNSAYGYRLRTKKFFCGEGQFGLGHSQWEITKRTLTQDPDSRRAVMIINSPEDQTAAAIYESKDVPCTLSLQFFIRDNKLDLHVNMRSNDVVWGLTYDLFSFTLLQECMLLELKKEEKLKSLELGKYYHTAGSIHVYEQHFKMCNQIRLEYLESKYEEVPAMKPFGDIEQLNRLSVVESNIRDGKMYMGDTEGFEEPTAWMLMQLINHRTKRDKEESKNAG